MEKKAVESSFEQIMMTKARQNKIPLNGSIELLPLCNMNCDMCYVRMDREEVEKQGGLRSAKEWLEIGRQMRDAGVLYLMLTGGEPLIYPEFREVYLGLSKMGMIITLNTNGTLLDEDWAEFFANHRPRRINITLYGSNADLYEELCHYRAGFQKTLNAISLLKEKNIDIKLNISVAKYNCNDFDHLIDFAKKYDLAMSVDTYMVPTMRERTKSYNEQARLEPETAGKLHIKAIRRILGEEEYLLYKKDMLNRISHSENQDYEDGMTCYAGHCSFTINWQGKMRPCVVSSRPEVDVFQKGVERAWNEIVYDCACIHLNKKCKNCAYRPICRTCPAAAMAETGAFDGVSDYICRYAKESYRLLCEM